MEDPDVVEFHSTMTQSTPTCLPYPYMPQVGAGKQVVDPLFPTFHQWRINLHKRNSLPAISGHFTWHKSGLSGPQILNVTFKKIILRLRNSLPAISGHFTCCLNLLFFCIVFRCTLSATCEMFVGCCLTLFYNSALICIPFRTV